MRPASQQNTVRPCTSATHAWRVVVIITERVDIHRAALVGPMTWPALWVGDPVPASYHLLGRPPGSRSGYCSSSPSQNSTIAQGSTRSFAGDCKVNSVPGRGLTLEPLSRLLFAFCAPHQHVTVPVPSSAATSPRGYDKRQSRFLSSSDAPLIQQCDDTNIRC